MTAIERLVPVAIDLIEQLDVTLADGRRITAEWGEPDERGWWTPVFTQTQPAPDPLREALARIFDHDGHTEMCSFIRYPGDPFQPPDPCTCGGEDLRAALEAKP